MHPGHELGLQQPNGVGRQRLPRRLPVREVATCPAPRGGKPRRRSVIERLERPNLLKIPECAQTDIRAAYDVPHPNPLHVGRGNQKGHLFLIQRNRMVRHEGLEPPT